MTKHDRKLTNPRTAAVLALDAVVNRHCHLEEALAEYGAHLTRENRAFAAELVYGVCRQFFRLDWYLTRLATHPERIQPLARLIILIGLYQLESMRVPTHAAIHATVGITTSLHQSRAQGFVNAVLRRFQREQTELSARMEQARRNADDSRPWHQLPAWLVGALRKAWPDHAEDLIDAGNSRPPMTLRVNRQRLDRDDYLAKLAHQDMPAQPCEHAANGIRLVSPCNVQRLPGFADGEVSVQDQASQLITTLAPLRPGMHVLDACAAPGGKTLALLEAEPALQMTCIDIDLERSDRIEQALARTGLAARVLTGDAATPDDWHDGTPYDLIIIDAPCSATGVLHRHPDIRLHRRADDIGELAQQQGRLLDVLQGLLAADGQLIYATCSVLPQENAEVIDAFLQRHPQLQARPIDAPWGQPAGGGRQLLTSQAHDGFFYALIGHRQSD